jgi:hypothetical protein
MRAIRNASRKLDRRLARLDTASIRTDIDFDKHVERDAEIARGGAKCFHIFRVIDAYGDPRLLRKGSEAPELRRADHLVCNQDIVDAAFDQRFGFAHFLTAHAYGPERDLAHRDLRALVAFGVRPNFHRSPCKRFRQPAQIALEWIELEDEGGRIDIGE